MPLGVKQAQTAEEMDGVRAVRFRVFVDEQNVPPVLEMDELDRTAFHAIAVQDGAVVGTGRLIANTPGEAYVGRMAVDRPLRRQGIGTQILAFLEDEARSRGVRRTVLHAQSYIKVFYARQGYQEKGEPFMEAGILHIQMFKQLD